MTPYLVKKNICKNYKYFLYIIIKYYNYYLLYLLCFHLWRLFSNSYEKKFMHHDFIIHTYIAAHFYLSASKEFAFTPNQTL